MPDDILVPVYYSLRFHLIHPLTEDDNLRIGEAVVTIPAGSKAIDFQGFAYL